MPRFTNCPRARNTITWWRLQKSLPAIRRTLAGMWRLIRSGWHHIQVRQEARATLRSMTDRELWDIGVSRSGIEAAIRRHETDAEVEILHPDIQAVIPPKRDIHCEAES